MNSKKTFPTVALIAILVVSIAPSSAFALTADEEIVEGQFNDFNPASQPQSASSVNSPDVTAVGVEMQLLMDVSGSVDAGEFTLQNDGYEEAFRSDAVKNLLSFGCPGEEALGIAVQFIYWSSGGEQQIAVPWSFLNDDASSEAFADAIETAGMNRPFSGSTAPGSAINFAAPEFGTNDFSAPRQVIDVSGDGDENDGDDTSDARDAALAGATDVINGIIISPDQGGVLEAFYNDHVIGGPGSFLAIATDFADFEPEIAKKILRELCPTVGGESLSINSASLMVAGLSANALWILPALAGIAGAGVFVIRSRMNKD